MRPLGDHLKLPGRIPVTTPDGEETYAEPDACPVCGTRELRHCRICHGAGVTLSHRWDGKRKQEFIDCECVAAERQRQRIERVVGGSGLERRRDVVFTAYTPFAGQEPAWQAAREFVEEPTGWLYFYGAPGAGKTTIASCAGNAWLDRAIPALFRVVPDLLDQLRATYRPDSDVSYESRFAAVMEAELLILDDYGRQKSTEWVDEKLFQLLDRRWRDRLPTIITTNLRLDELDNRIYGRVTDANVCRLVQVGRDDVRPRQPGLGSTVQ